MHALGFEAVFTIVVPGTILFTSVFLIVKHFAPTFYAVSFLSQNLGNEWLMGAVVLVGSVAFGGVLATLMGFLEEWVFDYLSRRKLKISAEQYVNEWDAYVTSLCSENNSYVARLAMFFFFESRLALSLVSLSVAIAIEADRGAERVACLILLITALSLFSSGASAHGELARYRHRRFAPPSLPEDPATARVAPT